MYLGGKIASRWAASDEWDIEPASDTYIPHHIKGARTCLCTLTQGHTLGATIIGSYNSTPAPFVPT
jgi:hypothetical protein